MVLTKKKKKKKKLFCFGLALPKGTSKGTVFDRVIYLAVFTFTKHRNFSLKNGWRKLAFSLPIPWTKEIGDEVFMSDADPKTNMMRKVEEKHAELTISSGGE